MGKVLDSGLEGGSNKCNAFGSIPLEKVLILIVMG